MGLYKRNNTWWVSFTLNKVRYQLSTHEKTKVKATEVANQLYNKHKDIVINKKVDFNTIVSKFLELSFLDTLAKASRANYKTTIKQALTYFKDKDIFNKSTLYEFAEFLHKNKKSSATIRKHFVLLSSLFNEVKKVGFVNENPIEELDLSIYKKHNKRERFLSKEERLLLFNNADNDLRDYIEFAVETGLRKEEQLSLKWNNFTFNKDFSTIKYYSTKVSRNIETLLSPVAVNILQRRLKQELMSPFPLTKGILHYKWQKLLEKTGIAEQQKDLPHYKKLVWHSLRHTFITWLQKGWFSWLSSSVTGMHAQLWVGHSDLKTTMNYTHVDFKDLIKYIKLKESD